MNKIKCLIVDDEPVAQRILEGYLQDLPEFELAAKCLNALSAREFLLKQKVDLMFLDLEMPKLKGFSFLKTLSHPPAVIITTAHREYALEAYELEVLDYLLKPITFERFLKALNRYKSFYESEKTGANNIPIDVPNSDASAQFLYVKSERKTLKLKQKEIDYIEGMNNYIKIHIDGRTCVVYSSLQKILAYLGPNFIRVHKSFIVNKDQVNAFSQDQVIVGTRKLPIGLTFRSVVEKL